MTIRVVVADANILFSRTLRDYLLYTADEGAIEVHWSQPILDEMSRNLRHRLGLRQAETDRLEALMNDYIEYALIEVDPDDLATVEQVEMHPKDRHVLAAAISADADILLTDNTKHFPRTWMGERDLELLDAAGLLIRLAEQFPDKVRAAHHKTLHYSPKTEIELLDTLEAIVGIPASTAIRALLEPPPPPEPPPRED